MGKLYENARGYFGNMPKIRNSGKNSADISCRCLIFRRFWDIIEGYDIDMEKEKFRYE